MSPSRCGIPPAGSRRRYTHGARSPTRISPPRRPSPGAVDRLAAWVDATFPRLKVRIGGAETCLYTSTPDERFVVERHGRIVVAAACNGQGFQLAPETGRARRGARARAGRGERPMSDAVERLDECLSIRDGELFIEGCRDPGVWPAVRHAAPRRLGGPASPKRASPRVRLRLPVAGRVPAAAVDQGELLARASSHSQRRGDGLRRLWPRRARGGAPGGHRAGADLAERADEGRGASGARDPRGCSDHAGQPSPS